MGNPKILIVDDDCDYASSLALISNDIGYDAESCNSGDDAYEMIKKNHYDLVFSDVHMAHGDGTKLLEMVSHLEDQPLIILMTGYTTCEFANLLEKGAFAILGKPFGIKEFEDCIEKALNEQAA